MAANGGYIKLWRKMLDSAVMQDDWLCRLWVWCLFQANWQSNGLCKRGDFVCRIRHAAEFLGVSKSKFHRGMQRLAELGYITVDAGHDKTNVSVCNYATYQDRERDDWDTSGTPAGHQRDTSGTRTISVKNERTERSEPAVVDPPNGETVNSRAGAGYFPFLAKDAKAVVDAYQREVGTAHPPAGAQNAVLEILGNGEATKDELLGAVKVWGPACKKANADPTKRMSAAKWFRDGCWRDFVGDVVLNDPDAKTQKRFSIQDRDAEQRRLDSERYARELAEHPEIATLSASEEFERRRKLKRRQKA